ncbi:MAG: hypothetical protein IJ104_07025 [Methanobrevibacter sp.]|nr:hypothetical protein [Methanobrevibacter sp.]
MARRNEGIIAFLMILALVAFVIGSAIGITVSIEKHENETNPPNVTHVENVTVEMTSNVNNHSDEINYDYDLDKVDFNENYSTEEFTVNN